MKSTQLIIFMMLRLRIGQEEEVLTCSSQLTLCLLIYPNGYYLSKLMTVNNCRFFLGSEKWNTFSKGKDYLDFANKLTMRMAIVNK